MDQIATAGATLTLPAIFEGNFHGGNAPRRKYLRHFSFSDRLRFCWTDPAVAAAAEGLFRFLEEQPVPMPLSSHYLPQQTEAVPHDTRAPYADACGTRAAER